MHPVTVDSEAVLEAIVRAMRTVAVVGMKDERRADEPAHAIPRMLWERGCEVIPVNPTIARALGVPALRSVTELTTRVDVLDVFRRPDAIPSLADEILSMPTQRRHGWHTPGSPWSRTAASASTRRATGGAWSAERCGVDQGKDGLAFRR